MSSLYLENSYVAKSKGWKANIHYFKALRIKFCFQIHTHFSLSAMEIDCVADFSSMCFPALKLLGFFIFHTKHEIMITLSILFYVEFKWWLKMYLMHFFLYGLGKIMDFSAFLHSPECWKSDSKSVDFTLSIHNDKILMTSVYFKQLKLRV